MKTRVFYFALAVAAAAIASSCVKEQAEPMDPEAEITGQVFEASHEVITKSTLVDLTPAWVEGDQISVSGSDETLVCTFVKGTENKFQTEEGGAVESPFYAIYPAADGHSVNRETGVFTATVPSLQKIDVKKEQNVAQGALVSVAYSETPELQFRNAVGLVKINIARNDIMAVKIEGLGENEFVAGKFTMKLNGDEEPEIALVEGTGATSVTLNTVENYGMFAPGEYYATVLPCNLSGIKVTFSRKTFTYGENGEVSGTGSETISVQKQSSTEIKRNAGTNLGTFFTYEISTADELLAWNKADAKWTVWDVVTLKDNIDCSTIGSSWTPKEFKGVFDGNGKTIDNLVIENAGTSAFFSKLTGAVVKDLTFGSGCSFVSTATEVSSPAEGSNHNYAASLAGVVREHTSISNVVNRGTVKIEGDATSGTGGYYLGGICAYNIALGAAGEMENCKNYGEITFAAAPKGHVYCAGVSGSSATNNVLTLTGCENHGKVQFTGENTAGKDINLGGITAIANKVTFTSCANLGAVESNAAGTNAGLTNIGGFVGVMNNACGTITDCVNGSATDNTKGAVTNNAAASADVHVGGFVGSIVDKRIDVSGFNNYGTITNAGAVTKWTAIGGVVGHIGSLGTNTNTVSTCENYGLINSTVVSGRTSVGGIVGFIDKASTSVVNCKNGVNAEIKNTGNAVSSNLGVSLGGIVGRIQADANKVNTIEECDNFAQIIFDANSVNDETMWSGAGGVLGGYTGESSKLTVTGCENNNNVTKSKSGNTNMFLGGVVGFAKNGTVDIKNCKNLNRESEISNVSTQHGDWSFFTGGIIGNHKAAGELSGCENYSKVINSALSSLSYNGIRIGGIAGNAEGPSFMTNCTNHGPVSDTSTAPAGSVGGVVGVINAAMTMTNCDNEGYVSGSFNTSTSKGFLAVGGIAGVVMKATKMSYCDNTGNVAQLYNKTSTTEYLGGVVAYASNGITIEGCSTNADVSTPRDVYTYVGAFAGRLLGTCSITTSKVYGSFDGKGMAAADYTQYCHGTGSSYTLTDGISFGTAE